MLTTVVKCKCGNEGCNAYANIDRVRGGYLLSVVDGDKEAGEFFTEKDFKSDIERLLTSNGFNLGATYGCVHLWVTLSLLDLARLYAVVGNG